HPTKPCTCTPSAIDRYLKKISGPLLDRISLQVEVMPVSYDDLHTQKGGECSADILKRVVAARSLQQTRYAALGITSNAQLSPSQIRKYCRLNGQSQALLQNAFTKLGLSARAHDHILRVARTIADLEATEQIETAHLAEAIQYRSLDRKFGFNQ
ncbi:MAG: ATP-binding protein, partial [Oscillospiraceae bacterium]|nr:ATP-binding protein [Oscillospiraceae bacterium]